MKRKATSTMRLRAGLGLALLLCAAGAGAQVFKWFDAKGMVHYGDAPPPDARNPVDMTALGAPKPDALPEALAAAAKANPVTLYTTSICEPCDQGRKLLKQRGIPFAEKTVISNADQAKLREAGSPGQLPLLVVGTHKMVGFDAGAWNAALGAAAYPVEPMLPPAYAYPDPQAAAPAMPAPAPARSAAASKPADNAPPGFQF